MDSAPDEARALPPRVRRVTLPPATGTPRTTTSQPHELVELLEVMTSRLVDSEFSQQRQQQMQQLQQTAIAALAAKPVDTTPRDFTTAELTSLRCGMRAHEIDAWLTRATARLCASHGRDGI